MKQHVSMTVASLLALACSTSTASAALVISVGTHNLVGDSPTTQFIDLYVINSEDAVSVGSFDLFLQIGDGTGATPSIVSVDLLTDTIFESNNSGVLTQITSPQSVYYGVAKAPGAGPVLPTASSPKIATVGISTLGFPSGLIPLNVGGFDEALTTYFTDDAIPEILPTDLVNGFLNIGPVPEPGAMAFAAGLGLLGFGLWRRHRAA